jgi:hypothetical protein
MMAMAGVVGGLGRGARPWTHRGGDPGLTNPESADSGSPERTITCHPTLCSARWRSWGMTPNQPLREPWAERAGCLV